MKLAPIKALETMASKTPFRLSANSPVEVPPLIVSGAPRGTHRLVRRFEGNGGEKKRERIGEGFRREKKAQIERGADRERERETGEM